MLWNAISFQRKSPVDKSRGKKKRNLDRMLLWAKRKVFLSRQISFFRMNARSAVHTFISYRVDFLIFSPVQRVNGCAAAMWWFWSLFSRSVVSTNRDVRGIFRKKRAAIDIVLQYRGKERANMWVKDNNNRIILRMYRPLCCALWSWSALCAKTPPHFTAGLIASLMKLQMYVPAVLFQILSTNYT